MGKEPAFLLIFECHIGVSAEVPKFHQISCETLACLAPSLAVSHRIHCFWVGLQPRALQNLDSTGAWMVNKSQSILITNQNFLRYEICEMYCVQQRTRFRLVSTFLVLALQSPALRSRHPRALVKSGPDSTISWGRINIKTYKKT